MSGALTGVVIETLTTDEGLQVAAWLRKTLERPPLSTSREFLPVCEALAALREDLMLSLRGRSVAEPEPPDPSISETSGATMVGIRGLLRSVSELERRGWTEERAA